MVQSDPITEALQTLGIFQVEEDEQEIARVWHGIYYVRNRDGQDTER